MKPKNKVLWVFAGGILLVLLLFILHSLLVVWGLVMKSVYSHLPFVHQVIL